VAFGATALVALALRDELTPVLLAAAVALPPMLVQDAWRFQMFAAGRQWAAVVNDALCLLVTISSILVLDCLGAATASTLLIAWGLGVAAGSVLGTAQLHVRPDLRVARAWLRDHRDYGAPLAASALVGQLPARAGLAALQGIRGSAESGRFAASFTVLLPLNTIVAAAMSFLVPELFRRKAARSSGHADSYALWFAFGLAAVLGLGSAAIALLPARIGVLYTGSNWAQATTALTPMAIYLVATTVGLGPRAALYLRGRIRAVMRNALAQSVSQFVGLLVGAAVGGAQAAAWGLAVGTIVGLPPWWQSFRTERALPRGSEEVPGQLTGGRSRMA
jgi:O-antigen/teichoic acid export membrane protein